MTRKRTEVKPEPKPDEPPRVARIWPELDGDDFEQIARRAAAEQPLFPPIEYAS